MQTKPPLIGVVLAASRGWGQRAILVCDDVHPGGTWRAAVCMQQDLERVRRGAAVEELFTGWREHHDPHLHRGVARHRRHGNEEVVFGLLHPQHPARFADAAGDSHRVGRPQRPWLDLHADAVMRRGLLALGRCVDAGRRARCDEKYEQEPGEQAGTAHGSDCACTPISGVLVRTERTMSAATRALIFLRVGGHYDFAVDLDETWSAVLDLCHQLGPVTVRRSRFAEKPAVFLGRREFVHWEGPGRVDLRIGAAGWRAHAMEFAADSAVGHDAARRDWIDLHLASAADVDRLRPLFEAAFIANA